MSKPENRLRERNSPQRVAEDAGQARVGDPVPPHEVSRQRRRFGFRISPEFAGMPGNSYVTQYTTNAARFYRVLWPVGP